jgi:hypothetical protein
MARIKTIFASISGGFEEKFVAESALHYLIKLSRDKLMAIHLVNFTLAHSNGTLTSEAACVQRSPSDIFLD